jgi:hypothetical protein
MNKRNYPRPPLASLAGVNPNYDLYGQAGGTNLSIRKVYGREQIRYLRCRGCQQEFSERKNTWCRQHRSLKQLLPEPVGKKSMNSGHRLWLSV